MYVAVDIGGTKTLVGIFNAKGQLLKQHKFPTADDYQQFLDDLRAAVTGLNPQPITAIAAGVAGRLDRANGIIEACGNLRWKNVPLQADLAKLYHCPVSLENDAKAGGLGEAAALKTEYSKLLYVPIGTGIGVAYITNGIIDPNVSDAGGRGMLIEHHGKLQPWEDFASGTAIVKQFGKKARDITDPHIWQQIADNVGVGILELLGTFPADVIVIGGGVGSHLPRFKQQLVEYLKRYQSPMLKIPPIRAAQNGEEAVLYGCYELIKHHA